MRDLIAENKAQSVKVPCNGLFKEIIFVTLVSILHFFVPEVVSAGRLHFPPQVLHSAGFSLLFSATKLFWRKLFKSGQALISLRLVLKYFLLFPCLCCRVPAITLAFLYHSQPALC